MDQCQHLHHLAITDHELRHVNTMGHGVTGGITPIPDALMQPNDPLCGFESVLGRQDVL